MRSFLFLFFTFYVQLILSQIGWKCGSFSGTGSAMSISGLGFQPDAVIIKSTGTNNGYIKTSTMSGSNSKKFTNNTSIENNKITSLDADGFSISNATEVNSSSVLYYWIAFKTSAGYLEVGSYTGNGTDNRNIVMANSFQPDYLIIMPEDATSACQRVSSMPADWTCSFSGVPGGTDMIQSFNSSGFQVGAVGYFPTPQFPPSTAANNVNKTGIVYHYLAVKTFANYFTVGSYTGNSLDNRNVTGVGLNPQYMGLMPSNYTTGEVVSHRSSCLSGDATQFFSGTSNTSNIIQSLIADGFQVGNSPSSNLSGQTYYYFAFGNVSTLPIELLDFKATNKNCSKISLQWSTASEVNNDYFTIQKSYDGIKFVDLSYIPGTGNSNSVISYEYIDSFLEKRLTYYRLKQTDYDGNFRYSRIIYFDASICDSQEVIYFPNPSNGILNLHVGLSDYLINYDVEITNSLGQIVFRSKGINSTSFIYDFTDTFPCGYYTLSIITKEKIISKPLIINY